MIWFVVILSILLHGAHADPTDEPVESSIKTVPASVEATFKHIYKTIHDGVRRINVITEAYAKDIADLTQTTLKRLPAAAFERKIRLRSYLYRTSYWTIVNDVNHSIDQRIYDSESHLEEFLAHNGKLAQVEDTLVKMNNVTFEWMMQVEHGILDYENTTRDAFEAIVADVVRRASDGDIDGADDTLQDAVRSFRANVAQGLKDLLKRFSATNKRLRRLEKVLLHDAQA